MILTMKDICKDYPMGRSTLQVLKHVNLQVELISVLLVAFFIMF